MHESPTQSTQSTQSPQLDATLPLTPSHVTTLNLATPATSRHIDRRDAPPASNRSTPRASEVAAMDDVSEGDSSPFLDTSTGRVHQEQQENISPSKPPRPRPMSRIISGGELSPLKILQDRPPAAAAAAAAAPAVATAAPIRAVVDDQNNAPTNPEATDNQKMAPPPAPANPVRSPRKSSWPDRRFPVKVSSPKVNGNGVGATPHASSPLASPRVAASRVVNHDRHMSLDDALHQDTGMQKAIAILEDEASGFQDLDDEQDLTLGLGSGRGAAGLGIDGGALERQPPAVGDESLFPDDTMTSTFSNFSAVPNTAMFAKIGHTPSRHADLGVPRRSISPPKTSRQPYRSDTTNLLLGFTEQLRFSHAQHQAQMSPSSRYMSPCGSATIAATPDRRSMVNLLDLDFPPMPTPRSIPTITPRELESLKSNFLSEISSLKASLSGKEAEAMSLKTAVGDAEKRVGTCMEQLREEVAMREQVTSERDDWERRGREMESVLRKVKDEIVVGQRERDELEAKLDESDKRRDMAETMAQEAESKLAAMRAGKAAEAALGGPDRTASPPIGPGGEKALTPRDVEMAVEKVARELHALYKSKHTEKITALKKSYERRWERRVRELEEKVEDLTRENEDMRSGRHATMTRLDPAAAVLEEERKAKAARDSAQITELNAEVEKLEAVVRTVQMDNSELRELLEQERVEKGELVQLAEEMMNMQQSFVGSSGGGGAAGGAATNGNGPASARKPAATPAAPVQNHAMPTPSRGAATPGRGISRLHQPESVRAGANPNRISGLRGPGTLAAPKSQIGRLGGPQHERKKSPTFSGGSIPPRSGIMSSIEKMGSYKGRLE